MLFLSLTVKNTTTDFKRLNDGLFNSTIEINTKSDNMYEFKYHDQLK